MRRRLLTCLLLSVLVASGCGATPGPQQAARGRFLDQEKRLHDDELARLCPSLYPTDFLTDSKKYAYTKTKKPAAFTPADRANAQRAGCTQTGTPPRKKR